MTLRINYKILLKRLIQLVLIIVGIILIFKSCKSCNEEKIKLPNTDSLINLIKFEKTKIIILEAKIKSLQKKDTTLIEKKEVLKKNYSDTKKDIKKDIKKGVCDTILVKEFINNCDSLIAVNDSIINNRGVIIEQQKDIIEVYKDVDFKNNILIDVQKDEISKLKKQVRKEKIKKVAALVVATIATTLAVIASFR
jgi:hypothetical protein